LTPSEAVRMITPASDGTTSRKISLSRWRSVSGSLRLIPVDDAPGTDSLRGYIERNSIALLSNYQKPPLDPASQKWRGHACDRGKARVRDSGLWNQNHVDEDYEPSFLETLERLVDRDGVPS